MPNRPVNDKQRKVLEWLSTGGSVDPPEPEMKLSAAALKTRGLVKVRRPGGVWTAELTDAGRHYIEHGAYPPTPELAPRPRDARTDKEPKQTASRRSLGNSVQASSPETDQSETASSDAAEAGPEVPLAQVVRRPHQAVKEVRDRPGRLPKFARRRCVLILQSLVSEALARGWKVTPVAGEVHRDYWGGRSVRYEKQSLLLIDAGHAPVGLVFDEVTKRQPHVDSKEDAARRARGLYVSAPTYDYTGTGQLRLHLTEHDRKMRNNFTDTATSRVEDKIDAVLDLIEAATQQAIRWEEERRRREEEEAARRREAQRIAELRHEYGQWERAFTEGCCGLARAPATLRVCRVGRAGGP